MLINFIIVIIEASDMGNVERGRFNWLMVSEGSNILSYVIWQNIMVGEALCRKAVHTIVDRKKKQTGRGQRYNPKDLSLTAIKVHLLKFPQSTNTSAVARDQPIGGHSISNP